MDNLGSSLATAGRLAFAIALVVFAVQHFLYARFIATLIPAWIPGHVFWAYFIGVAFVGAAVAIATKVQGNLQPYSLERCSSLGSGSSHASRSGFTT